MFLVSTVSVLGAVVVLGAPETGLRPRLAQVNIGGIIRQGVQAARNANLAADCREAADWLAILDRELPSSTGAVVNPADSARMMNLYRDEYFVPLMGKPYAGTTPQERTAYHQRAFRFCGPQQLDPQRLAVYNRYRFTTNGPFLVVTAAGGVIAAVAEIENQLAWTKSVTQTLDRATFDEVGGYLKQAQTSLAKLWPREQQEFINVLTGRQRALARTTIDAALTAAQQSSKGGLEGARAMAALHTTQAAALQLLDAETARSYRTRIDDAVASALKTAVASERQRLEAVPAGFDGVIAINAWRRTFESNFQGFNATPESTALLADAARRQSALLTAGVPEFKQLAAEHPKPVRNGMDASQFLNQLFPDPASRALPEFAQYRAALDARLKVLADAEAVERARVEAARLKNSTCDDLASHPDDAGRPAAVAGVDDDNIRAEVAIERCALALKQNPKSGRVSFQLGRAYWAAGRHGEAIDAFLNAEELGHAPAYYYLGLAYEEGRLEGEPADPTAAREMFLLAAAEGFDPAVFAYSAGVVPGTIEDFSAFDKPAFIRGIYEGTLVAPASNGPFDEYWRFAGYMRGIRDFLALTPNEFDETCSGVAGADLGAAFERLARQAPNPARENPLAGLLAMAAMPDIVEPAIQSGTDDVYALVTDYGGCNGPVFKQFYANYRSVLLNAR